MIGLVLVCRIFPLEAVYGGLKITQTKKIRTPKGRVSTCPQDHREGPGCPRKAKIKLCRGGRDCQREWKEEHWHHFHVTLSEDYGAFREMYPSDAREVLPER